MSIPYNTLKGIIFMIILCVSINIIGYFTSTLFDNLLYLDMIGTCVGGFLLGPWYAALIGGLTNFILRIISNQEGYIDYAIVNMIGGLIIGFLTVKFRKNDFKVNSVKKTFWLLISWGFIVGVICSIVALLIRFNYVTKITEDFKKEAICELNDNKLNLPNDFITARVLQKGDVVPGDNIFNFLKHDLLLIIPDKLFSVAFAFAIVIFVIPFAVRKLKFLNKIEVPLPNSMIVSILIWTICFGIAGFMKKDGIKFYENVSMEIYSTWLIPLIVGIIISFFYKEHITYNLKAKDAFNDGRPKEQLFRIYEDVIYVISGYVALMMTINVPILSDFFRIASQEGLGLITFFILSSIIPRIIRRYILD